MDGPTEHKDHTDPERLARETPERPESTIASADKILDTKNLTALAARPPSLLPAS